MIIENDVNKLEKQYNFLKTYKKLNSFDGFTDSISRKRGKLNLNFCPENEIA